MMSIINQALKKAQREQFLQRYGGRPQGGYIAPVERRRWPLWLLPAALLLIVAMGAALYSWSAILAPVLRAQPRTAGLQQPDSEAPAPVATSVLPLVSPVVYVAPRVSASIPPSLLAPRYTEARSPDTGRAGDAKPTLSQGSSPATAIVTWQSWPDVQAGEASEEGQRHATGIPQKPPQTLPSDAARRATALPVPQQVASLRALPASEPVLPTVSLEQALVAQKRGEIERAIMLLEQFIVQNTTSEVAYNALGSLYYQQKRYQQAMTMYQQALGLDPSDVKARNNLGNAYMQMSMDHEAMAEFQQALRLDSSYGLAYYNLACLHARAGRETEAAAYLQQAITLEPEAQRWAQTDTDFTRVRTGPGIRQLLER